ncbi:3-hydroxyacyl-CoA dehydrogenase family protein [Sedimentitalea sp.]|uniref:3-hydroxyacyl-CoA dehydrogenase family protein n=1 Tax=Sedimentitalea sp. TaxID=2048915 RepID=UPI003298975C
MTLEIQKVAVIGAGTMGHALALVHGLGGCDTTLYDRDPVVLANAVDLIAAACKTLVEAGTITDDEAIDAQDHIVIVESLQYAVEDGELVVEAVVEKPDIKRAVFEEIDRYAPAQTIIASNTSYLDIFPLVPDARQSTAAVAHWYTPPYIIDLVDLSPGPQTRPEIIPGLKSLYERFGKAPLVFDRLVPGYVANRLQAALNLECLRMIDEGWVKAEDIDYSIRYGLVERLAVLGHMRKMDYTGLAMVRNGIAGQTYQPPENTGATPALDRLIEAGRSGVNSGSGFYDYGDTPAETLFQNRDLRLLQFKAFLNSFEGDE